MKIGIVCPYSFDTVGGVQFHVRDLAVKLIERGHEVSVLAPANEGTAIPGFVVSAGGSVAIPYNGSVARLSFGMRVSKRVSDWLDEHDFDILHIHEPITPSIGLIALNHAECPVVATFHSAQDQSRALHIVAPMVQYLLEKITARIAVSQEARRTLADHLGGTAVVIPNGVFVSDFSTAPPDPRWMGARYGRSPTIAFLGRLDEPRKGLAIFAEAIPLVHAERPDVRFLIAGRGDAASERAALDGYPVEFLGGIGDDEKAGLFAAVDQYVAPQTGGESFGIVLVEAMGGGARVVSSDIPAFRAVLDHGAAGALFETGSASALATTILEQLAADRTAMDEHAAAWVRQFDWDVVTAKIQSVYRVALDASAPRERVRFKALRRGGR